MSPAKKKAPPKKGITSWSFSRYRDYHQCPLLAKFKHVDRLKEPGNKAMDRGSAIGKHCELYIKGAKVKLAPEVARFKGLLDELRKQFKKRPESMVVENTWAFTKDWSKTTWDDWDNCWLRVKVDCARTDDDNTMDLIDFKTGKYRQEKNDEYMEQLELYALAALVLDPKLQKVVPRLVYLDLGIQYPPSDEPVEYTRKDIADLKKTWDKRTKRMFVDRSFAPKPNSGCSWCWFGSSGKDRGGPGLCRF